LLAPILEGKADAVFGSRFASSGQRKVLLYWHSVANRILTWMTNVLNDINLTDMETCYKAVRSDILKRMRLTSNRFGIEPEMTTRLAQWNIRIYEVPVSYHGRTVAEGKKIGWKDAVSAVWCLIKFRFLDRRFTTHEGFFALQSLRRARRFNKWMLSQIKHHIGSRVLEAGCGIGNFTESLIEKERLVSVDSEPFYVEVLRWRFGHLENVRLISQDLGENDLYRKLEGERLDTIICLNVLEHIDHDTEVLANYYRLLEPGGRAIVLVPCHGWLTNQCDSALGHRRRYEKQEVAEKMREVGFEVVELREFNRLGALGWYANGRLGRTAVSPSQLKLFERLLPLARLLDRIDVGPGLSVIAVGRKPAACEGVVSATSHLAVPV
jgi:SAM-dependent methyltransferase